MLTFRLFSTSIILFFHHICLPLYLPSPEPDSIPPCPDITSFSILSFTKYLFQALVIDLVFLTILASLAPHHTLPI